MPARARWWTLAPISTPAPPTVLAPAFWQATSYQGKPYALPHHTDTFALYYNRDVLRKLDVEAPTSLDKSWSWPSSSAWPAR